MLWMKQIHLNNMLHAAFLSLFNFRNSKLLLSWQLSQRLEPLNEIRQEELQTCTILFLHLYIFFNFFEQRWQSIDVLNSSVYNIYIFFFIFLFFLKLFEHASNVCLRRIFGTYFLLRFVVDIFPYATIMFVVSSGAMFKHL